MERQFTAEIESLKLGEGETFRGEGILAVTKALLQSAFPYVGGYQARGVAPARRDGPGQGLHERARRARRGVHQRGLAAAMLGASVSYPVRGAVTWNRSSATTSPPTPSPISRARA